MTDLKGFDSLKDLDHGKFFCLDCGARVEKIDEITRGRYKLEVGVEIVSCTNKNCICNIDHPLNPYTRESLRRARERGKLALQLTQAKNLDSPLVMTNDRRRRAPNVRRRA